MELSQESDLRFIGEEEKENILKVLESQQLCYFQYDRSLDFLGVGNYVKKFEQDFARHMGLKYALALNSGTSAVEATLGACEILPGDEVIVTPKSFIASCMPVLAFNAIPVFADVDPRTGCLTAEDIEKKITDRTKAILLVHLFGQPADIDPIMEVAGNHDIYVIEDCAEAYDAYTKDRKVGTIGDVAAFSLQQSKHITTGEGGLIAMNNDEMYERSLAYSNIGSTRGIVNQGTKGNFFSLGHNHRMSELTAAVGVAQLSKIEKFNQRRRFLVETIEEELRGVQGINLPYIYPDTRPNYWLYSIIFDKELGLGPNNIIEKCREEGVELSDENKYWHHVPCYMEPLFEEMNRSRKTSLGFTIPDYVRYEKGVCPKLEEVALRSAIIPVHHGIPPEIVRSQARAIRRVVERQSAR